METDAEQALPPQDEIVDEEDVTTQPEIPLGIVLARILVVSAMSFAAALAIFCLVGGIWIIAGLATVASVFFLLLMFGIERLAEH
jgi:hypothetical protein